MARSFLAVLLLPIGCSPGEGGAAAKGSEPPASQIPTGRFVGDVVETMDAGTYTYVALERGGERVWAAGPKTAVAVGDEIAIPLDMRMENFTSETLGRTFDAIYFVSSLGPGGAGADRTSAADPHAGIPQFGAAADAAPIDPDSIEKPDGGYRVAELWSRRGELAGKEVVVRGRVVKYNAGILGRNWLHLRDGSGDPAKGDHDLTVTTQSPSKVGDLVTVRGVVAVDQDFGAGYRYEVLVEQATVEIE